ncbi:MAG: translesion error-prone DNA polymerase V autoproteolytic subunit [Parachlamydiales bacterium]|jgi:DNA polymerase V
MSHNPLRPVEIAQAVQKRNSSHPFATSSVQAGFPSPADDHIERQLDLNELLIQHPAATFYVRVEGDSMLNASINSGDILIVDRALTPIPGKIIIAILNGEFTVKRFTKKNTKIVLVAENPAYPDIQIQEGSDFQIWGVVTYVIHKT